MKFQLYNISIQGIKKSFILQNFYRSNKMSRKKDVMEILKNVIGKPEFMFKSTKSVQTEYAKKFNGNKNKFLCVYKMSTDGKQFVERKIDRKGCPVSITVLSKIDTSYMCTYIEYKQNHRKSIMTTYDAEIVPNNKIKTLELNNTKIEMCDGRKIKKNKIEFVNTYFDRYGRIEETETKVKSIRTGGESAEYAAYDYSDNKCYVISTTVSPEKGLSINTYTTDMIFDNCGRALNNHKNNEISYRDTDDMTSIIIQDSVNLSTTEEVYDKFGRLYKTVVDGNEIASFVYNDTNCGAERSIMNGTEWIHVGELFSNK